MKRRILDLDGPVHHVDFGGEGPPVVLVHGLGGSHANWLAVGETLGALGRVRALDLLGFGRTPLADRRAGLEAQLDLLDRFLEATGRPALLVGNSMGGLLALLQAARSPDSVRGLVLANPAVPLRRSLPDRRFSLQLGMAAFPVLGEWMVRSGMLRVDPERYVQEFLALVCARPERVPPAVVDAHVAMLQERRDMAWAPLAYAQATRSLLKTLMSREVGAALQAVQVPTLLVHGEADRLVPRDAVERLQAQRPDWALTLLPDVGHAPMMEAPDTFARTVLDWAQVHLPQAA